MAYANQPDSKYKGGLLVSATIFSFASISFIMCQHATEVKDKTTYVFPVEKVRPLQDLVGVFPEYITINTPVSGFQLLNDAVIQKPQEFATLQTIPYLSEGCHD